jgi:hypothetical protein
VKSVEREHPNERAAEIRLEQCVGAEFVAIRASDDRSIRVERAPLIERKQPLDVVVDAFDELVIPAQDVVEATSLGIRSVASIETQQRVLRQASSTASWPRSAFAAAMILVCRCEGTSS